MQLIPVWSWLQTRLLCTFAVHFQLWEQLHIQLCNWTPIKGRGQKISQLILGKFLEKRLVKKVHNSRIRTCTIGSIIQTHHYYNTLLSLQRSIISRLYRPNNNDTVTTNPAIQTQTETQDTNPAIQTNPNPGCHSIFGTPGNLAPPFHIS
jgi:hypothetical protein